ncbi:hypothetical protein BJX96DRAFT_149410 [Aspergillus floccosus]
MQQVCPMRSRRWTETLPILHKQESVGWFRSDVALALLICIGICLGAMTAMECGSI